MLLISDPVTLYPNCEQQGCRVNSLTSIVLSCLFLCEGKLKSWNKCKRIFIKFKINNYSKYFVTLFINSSDFYIVIRILLAARTKGLLSFLFFSDITCEEMLGFHFFYPDLKFCSSINTVGIKMTLFSRYTWVLFWYPC